MSLQLLPSGCFEITLEDGSIIKGQFSTAALKKLSLKNGGIEFTETLELVQSKASFKNFIQFIQCACDDGVTEFQIAQAIEEMNGFDSEEFQNLLAHFMDRYVSKKNTMTEAS
jgi:hypothetical protein